jgi:predicted component of type VI protein secretion system
MKEITLVLRFVVIGLIYIILFRLIKIVLKDMRITKNVKNSIDFALEVTDAPDLSGIAVGTIFPLTEEITIGRSEENGIRFNDPFVSSKHAKILFSKKKVYIKDLESTNGTLLNNKTIEEEIEILDGDIIEIGRVTFRVIG